MSFADIMKRGKKQFQVKEQRGEWGRCEYCDERKLLFPYKDNKNEAWQLCELCSSMFIKEVE